MSSSSILVLGGPDCGKTNFIGRLWLSLNSRRHALVAIEVPPNIDYVLDTAEHLCAGRFAPRSEHTEARRDFEVVVGRTDGRSRAKVVIPDISGELWKNAVESAELDAAWMEAMGNADGALLFVRVGSEENIEALNWVTSGRLLAKLGKRAKSGIPTQVMLCELLRFLELKLARRTNGSAPKVAVVVAAWDSVDPATSAKGPERFLAKNYPLFAGRLQDTTLSTKVFGLSIVGGDLQHDDAYREQFLEGSIDEHGWISACDQGGDNWVKNSDLTLPIAWVADL
ncbi:MAG: hypothetical protein V4757_18740 [Pseudomonadota bacterium]